jgi:enoyl-[acyl-carrier protein] reductase II
MFAAMVMGAEGVQLGTRFVASNEASVHPDFKKLVTESSEGDTMLSLKSIVPVRLLKNKFYRTITEAEQKGADKASLSAILGRGRAKKGMFEGDLEEGELEIGQVSAIVKNIQPAAEIVEEVWQEFESAIANPLRKL